ncbi:PREDICTED: signal peptide peptidase-like 3 [Myotis davidii]|uniref:signal peptide peptidase-like 3 n=1 Tax=Myotis davidii TaxID=225400 RepID=UPI0007672B5F|nr:PREDICTED: signal peptide peptidase-like 3 [Myotis davidii]
MLTVEKTMKKEKRKEEKRKEKKREKTLIHYWSPVTYTLNKSSGHCSFHLDLSAVFVTGDLSFLLQTMNAEAYSLVDSSQVSTFLISILLIVYGSFRSLNMDFENQDKEKDSNSSSGSFGGNSSNNSKSPYVVNFHACRRFLIISVTQFIHWVQDVLSISHAIFYNGKINHTQQNLTIHFLSVVLATIAFAFLLLPMCQYLTRPCSPQNKISFGCCGRFTAAELLSFSLSVMLVLIWVLTGHWLLMDALAMGLCVAMIAFVRLPSLKVSCLLLSGLLIYDVFWVFFSAYIFNSNVMVKVATQPADNPLDVLSRKLHLGPNVGRDVPRLSLPGKLVFPSSTGSHFSMLGIGDIVMPGLLLCFVLRYDNYKKQANGDSCGASGPANISGRMQKVSYFHCTLIGYFVGLLTATVASRIHRAAQPALLYLVPFTLLPLLTMAYLKGDLRRMWSEPFHSKASSSRFLEV